MWNKKKCFRKEKETYMMKNQESLGKKCEKDEREVKCRKKKKKGIKFRDKFENSCESKGTEYRGV